MADDWDGAAKAAMKVLGKSGDVPKPKPTLKASTDQSDAGHKDLSSAIDAFADVLTQLEHRVDWPRQYLTQFQDEVNAFDYGLDRTDPAAQKKVAAAKRIINAWLDMKLAAIDARAKKLHEARKSVFELKNRVAQ